MEAVGEVTITTDRKTVVGDLGVKRKEPIYQTTLCRSKGNPEQKPLPNTKAETEDHNAR